MARALLLGLLLAVVLIVAGGNASAATTWTVTKTADTNDGACAPANCSLRDAIVAANADSGDTVVVPAGDYLLGTAQLTMTSSMTISGAGAAVTTIHAPPNLRVLGKMGGNSTISGVTVTGGAVAGAEPTGGGIENDDGDLVIRDSVISGNTSTSGVAPPEGAGIYVNTGDLTIANTTISDNHGTSATQPTLGGAIFDQADGSTVTITGSRLVGNTVNNGQGAGFYTARPVTLNVTDSTFQGNQASAGASALGGAIFNNSSTLATISGSTFSMNTADGGGGAWFGSAPVNITNSTVQGNSSPGPAGVGGAIFNNGAAHITNVTFDGNTTGDGHQTFQNNSPVTIVNSIISTPGGDACELPLTSLGHNIENVDTCGLHSAGDLPNTDPKLGVLGDNGGPTFTELPSLDSPALNAGLTSSCPPTDQRGVARPQDGACDIGAVERTFAADLGVTATVSPRVVKHRGQLTFTVKVTNAGPDTATGVQFSGATPAGSSLVSVPAECGGKVTCNLGSLVPGAAATVTLGVKTARAGQQVLSVHVTGSRPDGNAANDSALAIGFDGPPSLSKLSISPRTFAAASHGATFSAKKGARVRFTLSRATRVRFLVQRRGRHRKFHTVKHGRIERRGKSGSNSVRFTARIRGRALKPGRYRLRLIPHDAGGAAKAKSLSFRIVPIKKR